MTREVRLVELKLYWRCQLVRVSVKVDRVFFLFSLSLFDQHLRRFLSLFLPFSIGSISCRLISHKSGRWSFFSHMIIVIAVEEENETVEIWLLFQSTHTHSEKENEKKEKKQKQQQRMFSRSVGRTAPEKRDPHCSQLNKNRFEWSWSKGRIDETIQRRNERMIIRLTRTRMN